MTTCSNANRKFWIKKFYSGVKAMKRLWLTLLLLCMLCGCTALPTEKPNQNGVPFTDTMGNETVLKADARVIACYGSFAECWLLSGGSLVGVTKDAVEERDLSLSETTEIVGTVKDINLEKLAALQPDYVILSQDIVAHLELESGLKALGISYGYFRVDTFEDYRFMMAQFCKANNRPDCYEEHVERVYERICEIRTRQEEAAHETGEKKVLLMRAFSTSVKVKRNDNVAGQILNEFVKVTNPAEEDPSLLEELSLEQIVKEDPDYILVLTMGDEDAAREYLNNHLESNPLWQGLSAIKSGNYAILPKTLFHYKPNNRWDESYEYLAEILYPEFF